jgi:hypothetical protein
VFVRAGERSAAVRVVLPVIVGGLGALGVAFARSLTSDAPAIVGIAAAVAVAAGALRVPSLGVAALGVGAAAAFVSPDGLAPLLVATGTVLACDVASADVRLSAWGDVVDGCIAVPALAGLAATAAAQPSQRAVVIAAAAGAAVLLSVWRAGSAERWRRASSLLVPSLGAVSGVAVAFAPDRLPHLGELPAATVAASRSLASGLAAFAIVVLLYAVRAERAAR